ncbi:M14 family metallopeptidase [Lacrimispora sp. JR3]|uniref:M14 family metallopeptidase n=1 Tax=Lacrimispora sinapis TaxID=3111456 RepID=UPI0037487787
MLQIGMQQLKEGTRLEGMLPVVNHELKLPFCVVSGVKEGPVVLITAGIHGAEYIGIRTAMELSAEIQPSQVNGTIVFLLVANPQAAYSYTRLFVPEDGKNLNRMFPGKKDGSLSEKIAYTIEKELHNQADYYIDLHAGDSHENVMPFVYFAGAAKEEVSETSKRMAEATGMSVRVKSSATTGSYNYAAIQGVPSILMERGGGGVFSPEELDSYKQEVKNVLAHLGVMKGTCEPEKVPQTEVLTATYIDSDHQGFWYPAKKPGESFQKGELLGTVEDVWGKKLQSCYAEYDGIVLYETVIMGVREGDSLIAYGKG